VCQAIRAARAGAFLALVLAAQLNAAPAIAGPFSRLQVLLPGETAAPGTSSGKTGSPSPQTAGVPFYVTVRACDASWTLVTTVTHSIRILSSDASASLPAPAQLVGGAADLINKTDEVVRRFGGKGVPPAHLLWDGKDENGMPLPDGIYRYQLLVHDSEGREILSPAHTVEISTGGPQGAVPVIPVQP
jgi:hypothetical protein